MIKRTMLALILILCVCGIAEAADPNESVTFWLSGSNLGYHNTDLSAWIGYRNEETEVGVAMDWRMFSEGDTDEDFQSNFALGPYAVIHLPGLIEINNPVDLDWLPLPDKIASEPFFSLAYLFDLDGKGTSISPAVGMRVFDMFAAKIEYNIFHGVAADDEFKAGLSLQHRF